MNFIISFRDPTATRYSLVGPFQIIPSVSRMVYCHCAIHSIYDNIEEVCNILLNRKE